MKIHRAVARKFGYELIRWGKHPTLQSHLANFFRHHRIDLVLDVGANCGQYGKLLRRGGYRGEIHSLEPQSEAFAELQRASRADERWFVHRLAAGASCGRVILNVMNSSVLSSFHPPSTYGHLVFGESIEISSTEDVETVTLDRFLAEKIENADDRRVFLKTDTQGFDLEVLAGASGFLSRCIGVHAELSLRPIYEGVPGYIEVLSRMKEYDFRPTGVFPVCREKSDLSLVEMDCVWVNALQG